MLASPISRFFGYMTIAVGVLITLLSGGCTLVAAYIGLTEKNGSGLLVLALQLGAPCIVLGLGLVFGGRALIRRPKTPPDEVF